jgi:GNAT superfamily N-acetyltransferase
MVAPEPTIRRATLSDVPAIRALLAAHGDDGPTTTVDIVGPYVRHFIEHATALVSERLGDLVAYGAATDTGNARHLADLFVRPDLLGQGIGRPLLDAVFGDAPRRTTFASADQRALALYIRAGMTPLWPSLYLEGSVARLPVPEMPIAIEPADPRRLADLERLWTGADRPADHAFWASQADAEALVVSAAGEPVAFAYGRARQIGAARAVDRLLVRPGAESIGPTLAAIRHIGRGALVMACVLGPSPVLPTLLAAGFRIIDRDQFMTSDPGLVDPARLVPNPGML